MAVPLLHLDPHAPSCPLPRRPQLRVLEGGRADAGVYRRRRLVAALGLVVVIVALALSLRVGAAVLGGGPASTPEPRPSAAAGAAVRFGGQWLEPGGVYVAQPGDTFWAIARALQPTGDLERLVDRLVRMNGGPELAVGERVRLPG